MSKTKWITLLSTAVLVMAGGSRALADDVVSDGTTIPDTSQVMPSLEPTTPTEPGATPEPSAPAPEDPATPEPTPTDPTQPSTGDEATPTDPSQPSEQPKPSEPETKPEVSDKDTAPAVETPKEEPKTPTTPTAPKEGEVSKATGQVVSVVTPEAPIETNTGVSIVSTKEGKLILSDGSKVAPEAIGAKTNDDKTITVTKADGSKATLPHAGDGKTLGLSLLGFAMAGLGLFAWKIKKAN